MDFPNNQTLLHVYVLSSCNNDLNEENCNRCCVHNWNDSMTQVSKLKYVQLMNQDFCNISNLFSPTMRRKMLRRCSIFNCFSLLNFSTLELFLAAVLHHYWISQPLFWFISVVLYFFGALWALIQQGLFYFHIAHVLRCIN